MDTCKKPGKSDPGSCSKSGTTQKVYTLGFGRMMKHVKKVQIDNENELTN